MFNEFFKKESPILGMLGLGGGIARAAGGAGESNIAASGGSLINYNNVNYHVFKTTGTFTAPSDFNTSVNYIILGGGGGASYSTPSGNGGPGI